jgi:hypothetical protein
VILPSRSLVIVGLPCLALACAAPMFQLGPAPPIPQAVAPPPLPNLRPAPEGPSETQVDIALAKSLPDFGQSSLGFLGFELPSEAGVGNRRAFLDQALTMGAIDAGFKHIADLGSAPEILVALNQEKSVNGVRTSTWWAGVMAQMAQVADVGRVDYILLGEFRNLQTTKQTRVTAFQLPTEELANYGTRYARYQAESANRIQAATAARQAYWDEFNRAKTAYEGEKAAKSWWERAWMDESEFKQKGAACEAFVAASGNAIVAMQSSEQSVPTPERFQQENRSKTQEAQVAVSIADLTVKLLEARTGQVVWAARLWRTAPEESSMGAYAVVARLLDELKPRVPGKKRK